MKLSVTGQQTNHFKCHHADQAQTCFDVQDGPVTSLAGQSICMSFVYRSCTCGTALQVKRGQEVIGKEKAVPIIIGMAQTDPFCTCKQHAGAHLHWP